MTTRKVKLPVVQSTETQTSEELNKKLKAAIRVIDKKLRTLYGGVEGDTPVYKIGNAGNFKYNELDSNTVNIRTATNLTYLIKSLVKLKHVGKSYYQECELLGVENPPVCTWVGYPIEHWIHDLEITIRLLANKDHIAQLNKGRAELESFLSNEDKLFNTLTNLGPLLK